MLFAFLGLALVTALVGCVSSTATPIPASTATAKPTQTAKVANIIPLTGFVFALYNNPPAYLYAGPSDTSTVLGQLYVGPAAQLLGTDPNNQWFLIKINGITAWVSAARVGANIAQ
jgi:hypothetical protein